MRMLSASQLDQSSNFSGRTAAAARGGYDAFVMSINSAGSALRYSPTSAARPGLWTVDCRRLGTNAYVPTNKISRSFHSESDNGCRGLIVVFQGVDSVELEFKPYR